MSLTSKILGYYYVYPTKLLRELQASMPYDLYERSNHYGHTTFGLASLLPLVPSAVDTVAKVAPLFTSKGKVHHKLRSLLDVGGVRDHLSTYGKMPVNQIPHHLREGLDKVREMSGRMPTAADMIFYHA
jgi:hypothetical protein